MKTTTGIKRLLVIDDEANMRHMLTALLEKEGYAVDTAADGADAIQLVDQTFYDVILCDLKMPRVGGIKFLKTAKDKLWESTVIMMSAYGTMDTALEAMKRKSRTLKTRLNQLYIDRSLSFQLKNTPLFQSCSDQFIEHFKKNVTLLSFRRHNVIAHEGETADAVYLVRSGFVKLTQKLGDGDIVVNYLS